MVRGWRHQLGADDDVAVAAGRRLRGEQAAAGEGGLAVGGGPDAAVRRADDHRMPGRGPGTAAHRQPSGAAVRDAGQLLDPRPGQHRRGDARGETPAASSVRGHPGRREAVRAADRDLLAVLSGDGIDGKLRFHAAGDGGQADVPDVARPPGTVISWPAPNEPPLIPAPFVLALLFPAPLVPAAITAPVWVAATPEIASAPPPNAGTWRQRTPSGEVKAVSVRPDWPASTAPAELPFIRPGVKPARVVRVAANVQAVPLPER